MEIENLLQDRTPRRCWAHCPMLRVGCGDDLNADRGCRLQEDLRRCERWNGFVLLKWFDCLGVAGDVLDEVGTVVETA